MISRAELKSKRWHRLARVLFYIVSLIAIIIGIGGLNDGDPNAIWIVLVVILGMDLIYYEGVIYIILGQSGGSIARSLLIRFFGLFVGENTPKVIRDSELDKMESEAFIQPMFIGYKGPTGEQLINGYHYFLLTEEEESSGVIKTYYEALQESGVDIDSIEKYINDSNKSFDLLRALDYMDTFLREEVDGHDGENFGTWLSSDGRKLYKEHVSEQLDKNYKGLRNYYIDRINKIENDIKQSNKEFIDSKDGIHDSLETLFKSKKSFEKRKENAEFIIKELEQKKSKFKSTNSCYEELGYLRSIKILSQASPDHLDSEVFRKWILCTNKILLCQLRIGMCFESDIGSFISNVQAYIDYGCDGEKKYSSEETGKLLMIAKPELLKSYSEIMNENFARKEKLSNKLIY